MKRKINTNYVGNRKLPRRNVAVNRNRNVPRQVRRQNPLILNYASHLKFGPSMKTVDNTFEAAIANPYVVDLNTPTLINIDTTGLLQNLATIQVGTGEYNRIGNKVSLKSLRLRFSLDSIGNNLSSISNARFMVIYDRQPNGAYPNITGSVLTNIRQDGTSVNGTMWSSININYFERFIVLMDEFVTVPPYIQGSVTTTSEVGPTEIKAFQINKYINLKGLETVYSNTAAPLTIAQIQTGALYILSIGDVAQGSAPYAWKGETRLRFKDC